MFEIGICAPKAGKNWKREKLGEKNRNSHHWKCSSKKSVLRNFAKFTGKQLCQSLFFNKVGTAVFL